MPALTVVSFLMFIPYSINPTARQGAPQNRGGRAHAPRENEWLTAEATEEQVPGGPMSKIETRGGAYLA